MTKQRWAFTFTTLCTTAIAVGCHTAPVPAKPAPAPAPIVEPTQPQIAEPAEPALPPIPSKPAPAPAELIVSAASPAPASLVPQFALYADRINPGAGAMVSVDTAVAVAAAAGLDLRGIDLGKPVRALVLDPTRFHQPLVLVVGVADEDALAAQVKAHGARYQVRNGFAAIGKLDVLSAAGGYALTTLLDAPVPAAPTVDVDIEYLMAHYGSTLEQLAQAGVENQPPEQRQLIEGVMRAYLSLFGQIDRARFVVDLGADASITMRLRPLPGTGLATFIARQTPSSFAELEGLPPSAITMGGRLDLGQIFESFGPAVEPMMAKVYGDSAPRLMELWRKWLALEPGEHGMTADIARGRVEMTGLLHPADAKALLALWTEGLAAMGKVGGGQLEFKVTSSTYKKVKLSVTTTKLTKAATPEQREAYARFGGALTYVFGVVGDRAVFTMGSDAMARAKKLVDQVAGGKAKVTASPALRTALDGARARRESYVVAFDLAELASRFSDEPGKAAASTATAVPPMVIGVGNDSGELTVRLTVPADQVGAIVRARSQP